MDPVTAAGLASSVITFFDFCTKLVRGSYEIYQSHTGSTDENDQINFLADDLAKVTQSMSQNSRASQDPELLRLCEKCSRLSTDLCKTLEGLRAKRTGSKASSITTAWKVRRKKQDVASLETRLEKYRQQIGLRLSVIF